MPRQERQKTKYPGVYFINGISPADGKPEKIYYIFYRKNGKQIEEPVGYQHKDDMTAARANNIRAARINNEDLSNKDRRDKIEADKKSEADVWTIERLWEEYLESREITKSIKSDDYLFIKHLKAIFGGKKPEGIEETVVENFRLRLEKSMAPQSVYYILSLLNRIVSWGIKKKKIRGLNFQIEKPKVNNEKTEDLTPKQLKKLLEAIDADTNICAANMMKLVLYTGMRRGEMFNLKWDDINWEREYILIREPKGGIDQKIPLNDAAKKLLKSHPRSESPYVFPGRNGKKRTDINKPVNRIKKRAGLPKGFRPLHGLRHTYASMLASSGKVDMYTLQKLLTHKHPSMTQRYAHLRDETLKKASNLAGDIIEEATK